MPVSQVEDRKSAGGEPSVSSSLERLVTGSQGVINKRIDLALLDAQNLLERTLYGSALVAVAVLLAAAAWIALTAGVVLFAIPDATRVVQLVTFSVVSGASATAIVAFVTRRNRTQVRVTPQGEEAAHQEKPRHGQD